VCEGNFYKSQNPKPKSSPRRRLDEPEARETPNSKAQTSGTRMRRSKETDFTEGNEGNEVLIGDFLGKKLG
jgi:hypothetical protein